MNPLWQAVTDAPPITATTAHIWAVDLDRDTTTLNSLARLLSTDERERASQFRLDAPRRRFIVSRAALRNILAQYLNTRPENIRFSSGNFGKPCLERSLNTGLQFNVAHSGNLALIAVTRENEIGVDVEFLRPIRHAKEIASRYFHPHEVEAILASSLANLHETFLKCWTGKEALLKAVGTGVTDALPNFSALDSGDPRGTIVNVPLRTATAMQAMRCWLQPLAPADGYCAAVAVAGTPRTLQTLTLFL